MAQYSANFNQAKVLVLGDVMLDRYWFGATNRISPEAPVPVVRAQDNKERKRPAKKPRRVRKSPTA